MIFYLTSTGNSKYTADKIARETGDTTVDIAHAFKNREFVYDISNHKQIGFVLPVFMATLPGVAAEFINNLTLTGENKCDYIYGVFTVGEASGEESSALRVHLERRGLRYDGSFDIVMPDNFIIFTPLPPQEEIDKQLDLADETISSIINSIKHRIPGDRGIKNPQNLCSHNMKMSTKSGSSKMHAKDNCTSCGQCVALCPLSCITLENNHPVWEGDCSLCLTCLHRCPVSAIEHGTETVGRTRYVNPRAGDLCRED